MDKKNGLLLADFRVLDLTDEKGILCSKILADMGADVITIEKPTGNPARKLGPFYHDEPDIEKSLYWFAYSMNKRSITLDIETADGRELFKKMVKSADFVIESFDPGFMESIGLEYSTLVKINPGIIMVSITPFGQTGPYVEMNYKSNDLILWGLGVEMYSVGDLDRPPVQMSFPQSYLHGGAEAAVAAMIAHYYRETTGEGQHIDVAIMECLSTSTMNALQLWDTGGLNIPRGTHKVATPRPDGTFMKNPWFWPCKDGWLVGFMAGGALVAASLSQTELIKWMEEDEPGSSGEMKDIDWPSIDMYTLDQETIDRWREKIITFFMKRNKQEIYEQTVQRKIMMIPVQDPKDLAESHQLRARNFYVNVDHPELKDSLTYCGPFVQFSETPMKKWQRAPLLGEHNSEIYEKEMDLSKEQLLILKQASII